MNPTHLILVRYLKQYKILLIVPKLNYYFLIRIGIHIETIGKMQQELVVK